MARALDHATTHNPLFRVLHQRFMFYATASVSLPGSQSHLTPLSIYYMYTCFCNKGLSEKFSFKSIDYPVNNWLTEEQYVGLLAYMY